jgi:hypothetical protein
VKNTLTIAWHCGDFCGVTRLRVTCLVFVSSDGCGLQGYSERDTGKIVLNPKNKGARLLSCESTEAFVVLAESP